MYFNFKNLYLIYFLFKKNILNNFGNILKISIYEKLSQDESNRLPVMQQSTKKSQTTYSAFKTSYLIHILLKSNVLNNLRKLEKISNWKKLILKKQNFNWTSKSDPTATTQRNILIF